MVLASLLGAGVAHAGVAPNPSAPPTFWLTLADDPAVTAAYALVPNDSPALLPLEVSSTADWWASLPSVPIATANVAVEGDPTGAVTAYAQRGIAFAELSWEPGAAREFGRTYHAYLGDSTAYRPRDGTSVYYQQSTFEFSYFDGSSADFLAQANLTLSDVRERYASAYTTCCEVDAALCSGGSNCFQCWDQVGRLSLYPAWTGPGLPYLSRETEPAQGYIEVTHFGEFCAQGTASAAGETRSFSACHTVSEWPSVEVEGRQTVFADSCRAMPEGYFPLTRLLVVRGETLAKAQQLLSSVRTTGQPHDSDPATRCGLASRPVESNALPWLVTLAVLGAAGRRRQSCRNPGR